jgi:hypothetical protein
VSKGRFAQAFRQAIKLAILLKTSTFKKAKKKFGRKQTKQSRAILPAILAYVQTGLKQAHSHTCCYTYLYPQPHPRAQKCKNYYCQNQSPFLVYQQEI